MKTTSTFSSEWLKAIAHLSRNMQDRIIADVTRWQLTGEMPQKMSAMRRALFYSIILQIDPAALDKIPAEPDNTDIAGNTDNTVKKEKENTAPSAAVPDYGAINSLGSIMPVFSPVTDIPSMTRAQRRRLCKALV